ncbi:MAG: ATP-binding cassette domain-containing protein [Methylobacterium sp.]|nr:ATP-binding cassette domain-containing protein [Methylobacterium sp.]MCA3607518.1 ATP-binding cassette domain-containing protein [Methylobacterium sp.]MCA3609577.1 ATP-binding cassette domain-containing protein [Methylobacterium sp.]MCA3611786.1 ATP-binding cassette domain-containing protein [Methylobacterium sp.]MCA3618100.1 ATP-binding cassette domain-containing protein [Methylobacterium sp.]
MAPPLLQLTGIGLTFGGTALLEKADLSVEAGERICLVGRNGSGKSTLLKIAAGLAEADSGTRFVQPGATMRYLPQEPDFSRFATIEEAVLAGLGPGDDVHAARTLIEALGLDGARPPVPLSGGETRRVALAQTLAPDPDILMLDEPTNHLDLPTIEWLEAELKSRRSALILISHDRRFLSNLTRATIWLDRGETQRLNEGFASFEAWRDKILAEEEEAQHKLGRKIADEEHWLRYGVTARRKRNVRRLEGLRALRREKRDYRGVQGKAEIEAAEAEKSGTLVIEAKNLGKAYAERVLVKDFSIRVHRGDRIGLVGANGSGKTTLVNLLIGKLEADSGTLRHGARLELASLEQNRDSLDPNSSVADILTGGGSDQVMVGGKPRHVVGYMKDFLFRPEQARTPLRVLSGGERARLMLARALALPSNLLVLDEPTNDLDLETMDVLQDLLADYSGTVILISHDRDFVDRVVDRIIVPDGNGRWVIHAGGYSDLPPDALPSTPRREVEIRVKAASPAAEAPRAAAKRKLSFQEKHQLETLPAAMEKIRGVIVKLEARLADPALYTRDPKTFADATALLAKAQTELAGLEDRWLELEILREALGG